MAIGVILLATLIGAVGVTTLAAPSVYTILGDYLTLKGLTSDPTNDPLSLWYRSDLDILKLKLTSGTYQIWPLLANDLPIVPTSKGGTGLTYDDWQAKPASFIIFLDGADAYAVHGTTGVLTYGGAADAGGVDGADHDAVIQACINALTSGGLIFIKAGTYSIGTKLTDNGQNNIGITFEEGATLQAGTALNNPVIELTSVGYWTIEGGTIDGNRSAQTGGSYTVGIRASACNHIAIRNVTVKNTYHHGIFLDAATTDSMITNNHIQDFGSSQFGITLENGSSRNLIARNIIDGSPSGRGGIQLNTFSGHAAISSVVIEGNIVTGQQASRENGIFVYDSSGAVAIYDITIRGNICNAVADNANSAGIAIESTVAGSSIYNIIVEGNICNSNKEHGIRVSRDIATGSLTYNVVVSNNICLSNTKQGIQLNQVDRCTVVGNRIGSNGENGIEMAAAQFCVVSNNVVESNTRHGIYVSYAHSSIISGNIVKDNDVANSATYDGICLLGADDVLVVGNRCQDNDRYEINVSNSNVDRALIIGNQLYGSDRVGMLNNAGTSTFLLANSPVGADTGTAIDTTGADHTVSGTTITATAGENLVFGDFVFKKSDGKYWKSDADASTTMPVEAMATATINADASGTFLSYGYARDDTWAWTVGALLYASTTAGALTETKPSGTGDQVQVVAYAITADSIFFNPSYVLVEVV